MNPYPGDDEYCNARWLGPGPYDALAEYCKFYPLR